MKAKNSWDEYFLKIVESVSLKSKDKTHKLGAVIVDQNNIICSTGFNGFPFGIDDNKDDRHKRPEKYYWTIHAEQNAICAAARKGVSIDGCTIYISGTPCMTCACLLRNSGIKRVVCYKWKLNPNNKVRNWEDEFKRTRELFEEVNIELREIDEK